MQLFLFLFCCRKSGIDSKSLRAFFTPLGQLKVCPNLLGRRLVIQKPLRVFSPLKGQPKGCPNRLGRRLVEGGSRPYGQSELKIKKATSFEAAFSITI